MHAIQGAATAVVLLSAGAIHAETIRVPADYPRIQGAMWLAAEGDTVLVASGTYSGPGNREIDFEGVDFVLRSEAGADSTVIDCSGGTHGVSFHTGESSASLIEGFEIRGGGNGLRCIQASPTIRGCFLTANETGSGAGIYCRDSAPSIVGCVISGNTTWDWDKGGSVYCDHSSPTLVDCIIAENSATTGAGIVCHSSSPTLIDCAIAGNSATGHGGGIYCNNSSPTLIGCTIRDNAARWKGGGVFASESDLILDDCLFQGNRASQGGGLYCHQDASTLTACTIATNSSFDPGGGICCLSSSATLTSCTIANNTAGAGGGLYVSGFSAAPTLTNCIVWGDAPEAIAVKSGGPLVTFSDVQGGWTGTGNIDADPLFCEMLCGKAHDLGLAAGSPCLGAGEGGADMGAWGESCTEPVASPAPRTLEVPAEYPTIGAALAASCERDTVVVAGGSYHEPGLDIPGLGLLIRSTNPADSAVVAATVIDGGGANVINFAPNRPSWASTLAGVTVTGGGTGITCSGASPSIDHCSISGNAADHSGGGLHCSFSSPTLTDCSVKGNSATDWYAQAHGGGLCCCNGSSPTLDRCIVQANTTSDTGGGLSCHDRSSPALTNCVIADNTSLRSGGGLHCREDSSPTLTNCTVQGNTSDRGGGIHCSASLPNLTNCILWGNSPEQIDLVDGSDITIAFSDIQGGWLGAGNIDADPGFRSFGGLDWLLRPGSPCIDTGSLLLEDGISDWHPRWPDRYRNGPRSDMGAFGGPGNSGWLP